MSEVARPDDDNSDVDEDDVEIVEAELAEKQELLNVLRAEIKHEIKHEITASFSQAPIPADDLIKLEEHSPGTIDWAKGYMDREQSFRTSITNRAADYDIDRTRSSERLQARAQNIMAGVIGLVVIAAVVLGLTGHSVESLAAVVLALGTLAGAFIWGKVQGEGDDDSGDLPDLPDEG